MSSDEKQKGVFDKASDKQAENKETGRRDKQDEKSRKRGKESSDKHNEE